MIFNRFRSAPWNASIGKLYGAIVAQAREPAFYRDYGVPDTVAGRFDLLVLHLVLLLERLSRDPSDEGIRQQLFDLFCRDLDDNLREMGIGDLAVPKRMRSFGEAFYGRQTAYLAAFAAADGRELECALRRNIFTAEYGADGAVRLARYVRATRGILADQDDAALRRGQFVFPPPQSIVAEAVPYA